MSQLSDFLRACNLQTQSGTEIELFYTNACELTGFPATKFANGGTLRGDRKRLDAAFDFSAAPVGEGYWRRTRIIINTGRIGKALEGETGSKTIKRNFAFSIAGNDAEVEEFNECLVAADGNLMFALKQRGHTEHSVLGKTTLPAFVEALEGDGGALATDPNRNNFTCTAYDINFIDAAVLPFKIAPN